jgi:hypothetical protein
MRAAARPGGEYLGKHHTAVLASYRLTWRQAFTRGLGLGVLAALPVLLIVGTLMLAPGAVDAVAGTALRRHPLPQVAWLAVLAPLPVGVLAAVAARYRPRALIDETGVHVGRRGPNGFAPWRLIVDVRAERRRRRTVVAIYLDDDTALRMRAPFDGDLLGRDPRFEQKLFMIRQLWETHRDWSVHE